MSDLRRQRETCRAQITSLKEQLQQQYLQQNTLQLEKKQLPGKSRQRAGGI